MLHWRFIFRQIAACRKQASIFVLCVALSLTTLVSLGALRSSVRTAILNDARELHAADIIIHSHHPFSPRLTNAIDRMEKNGAAEGCAVYRFYSMARNAKSDKTVLAELKIVGRGYPFYGRVLLASGRNFADVLQQGSIVVESEILSRLRVKPGDMLRIGAADLRIADVVLSESDRPVNFFTFGPRIFVAEKDLAALDLIKKGSRVQYDYLLKVNAAGQIDALAAQLKAASQQDQERVDTYRTARSGIKRFFDNFLFFLNLIGIFTLLLAGIGIQTSLYALLRENYNSIAIMKSIGATGRFLILHFFLIVIVLGITGSGIGLAASLLLQIFLPTLFAGILPASASMTIAWQVVGQGIALGLGVALLFSILPLQRLMDMRPAYIFRKELHARGRRMLFYGTIGGIVFFFVLLVIWQVNDLKTGLYFVAGLAALLGLAALSSSALLWLLRKRSPRQLALRQALKGLHRPGNATRAILITLTASLAVLSTISLTTQNLRQTFVKSYPADLPNAYFLDIQTSQKEKFARLLGAEASYYPIVRARISTINGIPIDRQQERQRHRDNLAREFNLTYRHTLLPDERFASGRSLFGEAPEKIEERGEVPVSVLDTVADFGNIGMNDLIVFNIQGVLLKARVTSIRTRTQSAPSPFFYFVFPDESLQKAPQTIFAAARLSPPQLETAQNRIVAELPNISVINVGQSIEALAGIMNKLVSIVQFFALFSMVAGLLIIVSSAFATRLARIREAVYFRILGATGSFIVRVFTYESMLIGLLCAVQAAFIAQIASLAICRQVFDIPFRMFAGTTLAMAVVTTVLITVAGASGSLSILGQKPLPYLRDENQE